MTDKANNIKSLIQDYLLDEGLLRNKIPINDKKLEFGFQFVFPPGPIAQKMVVINPKNKDLIIISNPIQISPPQVEAIRSSSKETGLSRKIPFLRVLERFSPALPILICFLTIIAQER
ncbi:MAG: DUF2299 family protein [Promethearchaeota archaeon]